VFPNPERKKMSKDTPRTDAGAPLGFDLPPDVPPTPNPQGPRPNPQRAEYGRQGDDTRPYCGLHFCLMASSGSKGAVTNYRCPVKGCNETAKRARPRDVVPRTPQLCPNCAPKPVACEVDRARSTPYTFKLVCPTCRWSVNVNRPDLAARAARAHRAEHDDLSAR
jgi:hypothetical protein